MKPALFLLALAALCAAVPLRAQTIRGVLTDSASGRPLEGAMLVLLDAQGAPVHSVLSDPAGAFNLRAHAAGVYRVRVDRIGYESSSSPQLRVAAGEELRYDMRVAARAVELDAIEVAAADRACAVRPTASAARTARVWEEARKALAATAWLQRQPALRYEGEAFSRTLHPASARVIADTVRAVRGYYDAQPFASMPAADLAANGYVREVDGGRFFDFFAPSADVLLSDEFLDTHCLSVVDGAGETAGLIGLAFEPVRGARNADIRGTLWLERRSAQLRFLEFAYTGNDPRMPLRNAGGRVEFAALPTGAWIITYWVIRVPMIALQHVQWAGGTRMESTVTAIRHTGGEVMRTYLPGGRVIQLAVRARVHGTAYDSTAQRPLAGAQIRLTGTAYTATSDSAGRFELSHVPAGNYTVEFWHPRLDSLPGPLPPPLPVDAHPALETPIHLATPALSTLLAAACPPDTAQRRPLRADSITTIAGIVYDPETGNPAPVAQVSFSWREDWLAAGGDGVNPRVAIRSQPWTIVATTDQRGHYWACNLPLEVTLLTTVRLRNGTEWHQTVKLLEELQVVNLRR